MTHGSCHLHPGLAAVTAGPGGPGRREFCTGRLIAPALVLTARHGVAFDDGTPRPDIEVSLIAGERGAVRPDVPVPAVLLWQGAGDIDVALLELAPPPGWRPPDGFLDGAPRWGEPVGADLAEVVVTGMSAAAARSTGSSTETETLRATVDPLTYTSSDRYALDPNTAWPSGWDGWMGMSGSSVLHGGGVLIGVVAWSDEAYEGRRLSAVPVRVLLADESFRRALGTHLDPLPRIEPIGGGRRSAPPPAPRAIHHTLKAAPRLVIDRRDELAGLSERIGRPVRPELVHALVGMAGVGKSALARHLAHQIADRFPDCQYELDLQGHTPDRPPLEGAAVMETLLSWAGIRTDDIPTMEGKSAVWRDWLSGRRALLLLDNVRSLDQIAELLPGYGDCLVLITSRNVLHDPARIQVTELDTLPEPEALQLLVASAGLEWSEDAPADPCLVAISRACGLLPLALQAVGACLRDDEPAELLVDMKAAARMADSPLKDIPDADSRVQSAFTVSYDALAPDPEQAAFFRALAMHPGQDLGMRLCVAATGLPRRVVRRRLGDLCDRHLLQRLGDERFGFHDLFLAYARERARREETPERWDEVLNGIFDHMLAEGEATHRILATGFVREDDHFSDPEEARHWLDNERPNLVAVTVSAITHGSQQARPLARLAHTVLGWAGMTSELATIWETMRDTARGTGDRQAGADAARGLGDVYRGRGQYETAEANYVQAEDSYRELGDERGRAAVLWGLGDVLRMRGRYGSAGEAFGAARALFAELGDRRGIADAMWGLGHVRVGLGEYPAARAAFTEAGDVYADLADRRGQAEALRGIADVQRMSEERTEARASYQRALTFYEAVGDRRGQATSLRGLGQLARLDGRYEDAQADFGRGQDLFTAIGDRRGQADMLRGLGDVERMNGLLDSARATFVRAGEIHREIGDRRGQAYALRGLGDTERMDRRYAAARDAYREALGIFEEIGNRKGLGNVYVGLAGLALAEGDPTVARQAFRDALRVYEEIGIPSLVAECEARIAEIDA
ncbi:tetratricopeptide repeat protein [Streptomyces sp. NPDC056910]|uniref:tetratricopeptide repeat protein n=1 Tax=Streptomyces sp. NPDC056910 TaxID=3345964 RepID=UPI0036996F81